MSPYERAKKRISERLADDAPPLSSSERETQMRALRALYGAPKRQRELPMSWLAPLNGDEGGPEE